MLTINKINPKLEVLHPNNGYQRTLLNFKIKFLTKKIQLIYSNNPSIRENFPQESFIKENKIKSINQKLK